MDDQHQIVGKKAKKKIEIKFRVYFYSLESLYLIIYHERDLQPVYTRKMKLGDKFQYYVYTQNPHYYRHVARAFKTHSKT